MAHSNHYFRMVTPSNRHVDLISRGFEYGEVDEVLDNMIQMVAKGPIYGTSQEGEVGIYLTEQQQNDLIAGILERRGTEKTMEFISNMMASVPDEKWIAYITKEGNIPNDAIHSDGQVQSKIHPANKTVKNKS